MGALWIESQRMTLPSPLADIGELYESIANVLPGQGFVNVQQDAGSPGDVHGQVNNTELSVIYYFIGDRDFWQVVTAGGDDDLPTTQNTVNQVVSLIAGLAFQ